MSPAGGGPTTELLLGAAPVLPAEGPTWKSVCQIRMVPSSEPLAYVAPPGAKRTQ